MGDLTTPSTPTAHEAAALIVEEVVERRARGELVEDESVLREHPELAEQLRDELHRVQVIERARRRAQELQSLEEELSLPHSERESFPGYEVLRSLGTGGQSRVYLARAEATGELFAIKLFLDAAPGTARHGRFLREAAVLQELDHRRIVPLIECGISNAGKPFIVTRYIEGENLNPATLCAERSEATRLALFMDVCEAVQAAHDKGVVHRDLKPENIRIDPAGQAHVLDFGLAGGIDQSTAFRSITATGEYAGTFMWSSPEQLRGDSPGLASDVYSLGVILHQLLCAGRFPPQVFDNLQRQVGSTAGVARRTKFDLNTPLSRACGPVIRRCLHADPSRRYENAGQLRDAVASAVRRADVSRTLRRGAFVAIAIAGVACIAATAYWLGRSQSEAKVDWTMNGRPVLLERPGNFVYCPPGQYEAGSRRDKQQFGPQADERRRPITIRRGFYLCTREVNQATYKVVMGSNPSRFVDDALPVDSVNYDDAVEFCRRLSEQTGKRFRLPTEWEWEYACRAGTTTHFYFGDDPKLMLRFGNAMDQSSNLSTVNARMPYNDGYPSPAPCGTFHANVWLMQDMLGNVWEWCAGPYQIDPDDPSTQIADRAPLRGGSWWDIPRDASERNPIEMTARVSTVGFRVALDVDDADVIADPAPTSRPD